MYIWCEISQLFFSLSCQKYDSDKTFHAFFAD